MNIVNEPQPIRAELLPRVITPAQLRIAAMAVALLAAATGVVLAARQSGELVDASATNVLVGAQAATPRIEAASMPAIQVTVPGAEGAAAAVTDAETAPAAQATGEQPPATDAMASDQTDPAAAPEPDPAPAPAAAPEPDPEPEREPEPEMNNVAPTLGAIKSKADEKGYDVHGHVEHSVYLLGQQVLIPGQAATGGFIQTSPTSYLAYSPLTAMLPVAIQDNKEVLRKKPNLEGEQLYRRLAQEYTGSNDYKKLDKDARRAINILTCTDWSLVEKRVRENTINHLLHSPISFGTIGSVADPISTDVTIDLGYTHTRDKNWTEVEYMGNNVYKITVVSNNNNGSHTGHAMGTAYVEMPAGTSLQEAKKIGNRMIPSTNKNNKLTIDPAARVLFDSLPRGASPMILFEHLSEAEQNAYFEGRGIEAVGKPNPDCNPLEGGILGGTPDPDDPVTETTVTTAPPETTVTTTSTETTETTMTSTSTSTETTETTMTSTTTETTDTTVGNEDPPADGSTTTTASSGDSG